MKAFRCFPGHCLLVFILLFICTVAYAREDSLAALLFSAEKQLLTSPVRSAELAGKVLKHAIENKNQPAGLQARLILAEAGLRLFRRDLAFRSLIEALEIATRLNDDSTQLDCLLKLGKLHWNMEDAEKASYYFSEAFNKAVLAKNQKSQQLADANLAYIRLQRNLSPEQADFLKVKKFFEYASAPPVDTITLIQATNLIGNACNLFIHDQTLAIYHYQKAIQLCMLAGDHYNESAILQNLAEVYLEQGKFPLAEKELEKSLALSRTGSFQGFVFAGMKLLAECAAYQMDYRRAYDYFSSYDEIRSVHLNESQRRATEEILLDYFAEKKESEKRDHENQKAAEQLSSEKQLRFYQVSILAASFALIIISSLFILYRRQMRRSIGQQRIVDQKNIELGNLNQELQVQTSEAEKAKATALDALKSKNEFLAVITHELRTPLHAVIAAAHDLEDSPDTTQSNYKQIEILKFSADNLLGLINNVLDINRIEAGKFELDYKPFSIRELLEGLNLLFKIQASEKEIRLIFRIDQMLPSAFLGDRLRLGQILTNLLSNAIRFTNQGEVVLEVSFEAHNPDYNIFISVSDTGIGMKPEEINRISGAFEQANSSIAGKYGGSGLGLSVTSRLIGLMGSSLSIKSESEKGSEFSFGLRLLQTNPLFLRKGSSEITEFDFSKYRLLFIEDVAYNRVLAARFFDKWKMVCDMASTGKEAIKLAESHSYDLILLDIRLPDMSGFEIAGKIRENHRHKSTPIIAMTASDYHEISEEINQSGIQAVLSKPFSPEDLRQVLLKWLGKQL